MHVLNTTVTLSLVRVMHVATSNGNFSNILLLLLLLGSLTLRYNTVFIKIRFYDTFSVGVLLLLLLLRRRFDIKNESMLNGSFTCR